uniref:Uncharacterized protein n=1 Tax=Anguilla anguilla TaxID=7936 RepID=A0A0E9W8N1_ANGAN
MNRPIFSPSVYPVQLQQKTRAFSPPIVLIWGSYFVVYIPKESYATAAHIKKCYFLPLIKWLFSPCSSCIYLNICK